MASGDFGSVKSDSGSHLNLFLLSAPLKATLIWRFSLGGILSFVLRFVFLFALSFLFSPGRGEDERWTSSRQTSCLAGVTAESLVHPGDGAGDVKSLGGEDKGDEEPS